ncbi:MAG TPA: PEGA domain-containing protein, partial [Candidatus Binatia bacterium]|nr:PEGA domain-containing protein [Candidatus Binatia bacterium]
LALAAVGVLLVGLGVAWFVWTSRHGTLLITSAPAGAQIRINGEALSQKTPLKLTRPKGSYELRAEYPGLDAQTDTLELRSGRQTKHFAFPHGIVVLNSQPNGALIRLEGTNLLAGTAPATTPHTVALKPGPVTFQLDLKDKGYLTTNLSVDVPVGRTNTLFAILTLPPAGTVLVEFDSNPRGAVFELDHQIFATNVDTRPLAPGSYKFTGRYRQGWPAKETNLVVRPNEEARVFFYFERARLSLDSEPPAAEVYVDNRLVGLTPTNLLWPTGLVIFRFQKTGYEAANVRTNIFTDNGRDDGHVELRPELVTTNGTVLLAVEPAAAVVLDPVSRQSYSTSPGQKMKITLPPGEHAFIIQATGYQSVPTNFLFRSKETDLITVRLQAELLPVTLSSDPPGAEFYVVKDDQLQGPLPSPARLEQGKHKLASRIPSLPRLGWITNDLAVWTNRANAQLFTFPATTLVITSSPPRAEIFELSVKGRREPLGRTPLNLVVRPGLPVVLEFVSTNGTDIHTNTFDIVATGLTNVGTYFQPPKPPPYVNSIGMAFEWIPLEGTNGGYWVGKYEVTQKEYETVMTNNPSTYKGGDRAKLPVETVSAEDARRFCRQVTLRDQEFLKSHSMMDWSYALPGPSQWLYYATGTTLADAVTSGKSSHPKEVGASMENRFGLFDVRGNVWEWCADETLRGAAYDSIQGFKKELELTAKIKLEVNMRAAFNGGFRCVLVPSTQTAQR